MKRIAIASIALLLAQAAGAGPNWQVTSFKMEPQDLAKVVAATDELMASAEGKALTGTVSLMVSVIDGSSPGTHSFISAFDSVAEREAWFSKLQASSAWRKFLGAYGPLTEQVGTSRMAFLKSWGEETGNDVVWEIHAFTVTDAEAFSGSLDTFMASETGKTFPGSVYLSAVSAAGISPFTHLISVGFESETESEAWSDGMIASEDWAKYLEDSGEASSFGGTFLIRTVKTWGATPAE